MKAYDGWRAYDIPQPDTELRFAPPRRWRFDWAWEAYKVAVEQDGGLFIRGGHSRGIGRLNDYEKDRAAMLLGWSVGRFSPKQVTDGTAATWVKAMIDTRSGGKE